MEITITGRKVTVKDDFRAKVQRKIGKFGRYFSDDAEAYVTVTVEKNRQTVEVTVHNNGMIYRAEASAGDMLDALDRVSENLMRQIHKNKTRLEKRLRSGAFREAADEELSGGEMLNLPDEEQSYKILRSKKFPIKPMEAEEAILQMNMLGHQFYMFRNVRTNEINVVYARGAGDYGLIEPLE